MADIAEIEIGIDSRKAERAQKRVKRGMRDLDRAADKSKRKMAGAFDGMVAGATKLRSIMTGVIAVMGARQGIKTIANFEQTMAGVRAVTRDLTNKEFAALNKQARELGATTVFSAQQAAEGMSFLGMAGFNAQQVMAALPGTLDLAAAGMVDLGTAADIASNVLQAFGLRTDEMGRVADVMAKAVATSNQNMYELAEAINYAAPTLSALGIQLEDVAAGASVLANQGIKASMAGTAMRMMFVKLIDPSKEAVDILQRHSLTIAQLNPRYNDLVDVFERLKALSPEELIQVFGARGIAGASAITRNMDQMIEYMKEYRKATGSAKEMAAIRLDTLAGDWQLLVSAVTEFTLQVGDQGAAGALRKLVQGMTAMVTGVNENWDNMMLGVRLFYNGMKAVVYDIHGAMNWLWDGLKSSIVSFLDWMLQKIGNALKTIADKIPEFGGLSDVRGEMFQSWRGINTARAALQQNRDAGGTVGDWGEWQFNRSDAIWAENKSLVYGRAGELVRQGLEGGPQRAATADEMQKAQDEAAAALAEQQQQMATMEITAKRPAEAFIYGWRAAAAEFGTLGERMAQVTSSLAQSMDQHMTDGLMDMIEGTKSVGEAFQAMTKSIIRDLIRVMIQQLIVRQVLQGLGGGFGGMFASTTVPAYHGGGVAGIASGLTRDVSGGTFAGARRYESGGIAGDEVPAILHRGEVVLNDKQMEAMSGGKGGKTEIINVVDPRMVDERIAKNPQAIINLIGQNARAVRRALNV